MTNIKQKALELVNEVGDELGLHQRVTELVDCLMTTALCRAIEKHENFRQEVSDAAEHLCRFYGVQIVTDKLERFIITKPDPLVEAIRECWHSDKILEDRFRAALAKRGLEIREKGK